MSKSNNLDEKFLVLQLIQGNQKAFSAIFFKYQDVLFKYCLKMVKSRDCASEIVQDTFLTLWLKHETLDKNSHLKSYLFTIVRNKTINFLKKAAKDQKLKDEIFYLKQNSSNNIETEIREKELNQIKKEALDILPPKRRKIFKMSRDENMNYDDIATKLNISKNTVRNQISSALETLRNYLQNHKDISFLIISFFFR